MRRYGLFTELQVKVLIGRSRGLTLRELAKIIGSSHQNIGIAERRAYENLEIARKTITVYNLITSPVKIVVDRGTHLMDIPRIIVDECDSRGIKLRADFTLIYKLIRFYTPDCICGSYVVKPILIVVDPHGFPHIYPLDKIEDLYMVLMEIEETLFG